MTRLFLPQVLADRFQEIHEMESSLRTLLEDVPDGAFEGLYMTGAWDATRSNVTDPQLIESFAQNSSINPRYPLRTVKSAADTAWLDNELKGTVDTLAPGSHTTITTERALELLGHINVDQAPSPSLWDMRVIEAAFDILEKKKNRDGNLVYGDKVHLVVKRGRDLKTTRSERAGIISGGEDKLAPTNATTLFLYRMNKNGKELEAWWPQLRFPAGNYILAFSFDY